MSNIERKLTTILAADVVGFSLMMGEDEEGTLASLKACRTIIDGSIEEHHGRIFGSAGDSLIAEFSSPVQAVLSANEFQNLLKDRNVSRPESRQMSFRVGINIGDVIIDGDNLYGDGVNIAARLETASQPGGICVSYKVYDEVRRKLDLLFVDGGPRQFKNIAEPISIFHLGGSADAIAAPAPAPHKSSGDGNPTIAVAEIKLIGGSDDEIADLAVGLREDIISAMANFSAMTIVDHDAQGGAHLAADLLLEGSIRSSGKRLRINFTLTDQESRARVWSERYDKTLDDLFDLEDEISSAISSVIRIRLKALEFEKLRDTPNEQLEVPDLLSKAAGFLVRSPGENDAVEEILRLALERAPKNSMACAMMVLCHYRRWEHSPLGLPASVCTEMAEMDDRAKELDNKSYFARLVSGIRLHDVEGDFEAARTQAEVSLAVNANFVEGRAMLAILNSHLVDARQGMVEISECININSDDPHRSRHWREMALAQFMAGQIDAAAATAKRLLDEAPQLYRNSLIAAALAELSGDREAAALCIDNLLSRYPELTLATARPTFFVDTAHRQRFDQALLAAGLSEN